MVTRLALEALTDLDATSYVLKKERKKELSFCDKCHKRLQMDERGQAVVVTFNNQGQEVSRLSAGGGRSGMGISNVDCSQSCTSSCTANGKCNTSCKTKCTVKE